MRVLLAGLLVYSGFLVFLNYACIAPFFPSLLSSRDIPPILNSLVFAIFALSYLLVSLLTSSLIIPYLGRSLAFVLSILSLMLGSVLMASLYFVFNQWAFITIALFARLLQGAATSLSLTLAFVFLSLSFPDTL